MRINSINNDMSNKNNQQSFKGTIDKSLIKYLKEVRTDVLQQQISNNTFATNSTRKADVINTTKYISNIVTKLNKFIKKTHPDTKLVLEPAFSGEKKSLVFVNSKLGTKIKGYQTGRVGYGSVSTNGIGIHEPNIVEPYLKAGYMNELFLRKPEPHQISGLKSLSDWTNSLTDFIKPEKVDEALFDSMIEKMSKKAESTSLIGRAITAHNAKKADKLAEEFGRKPEYTEKFNEIAKSTKAKTELSKKVDASISKEIEELKNIEIK